MKSLIFFVLIALGCQSSTQKEEPPGQMENNDQLSLRIERENPVVLLNQPFMVKVILSNNSQEAIIVNNRMALGLEQQLSRELYPKLVHAGSSEPVERKYVKTNRDKADLSDYVSLAPGERIEKTVDIFSQYPVVEEGRAELILFYQADESYSNAPEDVFRGIVSSNMLEIELKAGTSKNN